MKLGTNERVRLELVVRRPLWSAGADGGRAFVKAVLEDTGYRDVRVYLVGDALPAGWHPLGSVLLDFPEWIALAEATWGATGAELADDLGELRVSASYPAPASPAPPKPASSAGGWLRAAAFGGFAIACAVLAWALEDAERT